MITREIVLAGAGAPDSGVTLDVEGVGRAGAIFCDRAVARAVGIFAVSGNTTSATVRTVVMTRTAFAFAAVVNIA